jgi:hypothetical protein
LHDPQRAAVNRGTEKPRDRRVALILNRGSERRKLNLVIACKPRVEIFEPDELLTTTGAKPHCSLPQAVHQVHVADLKQTERAGICGEAAAIIHHAWLLLFDVDNHVALFVTGSRVARWDGVNDDLSIRIREIKLTFRVRNPIGPEYIAFSNWNCSSDRLTFGAASRDGSRHAVDHDLVDKDFVAFVDDGINELDLFFIVFLWQLDR